jgi:putative membrane protein
MDSQPVWVPYCGAAPVPAGLLERWNFDPLLLLILVALLFAYQVIVRPQTPRRQACFASAMLLAIVLFVSPVCALSSALFAVRVVHHIVLTVVLAPLLVASLPPALIRIRGSLAFWTVLQALVFWAWHWPGLYGWALSSDAAYWLMQITLLASAGGFWTAVRRASAPVAAAALLATMVQMGLLGALITFAPSPLYAPHLGSTIAWGSTPLEDQQLAGLIMWAPAAALYLAAALLLIGRWLHRQGRPMPAA